LVETKGVTCEERNKWRVNKKTVIPFRIAAYIYGAEGRIGQNINDIDMLLESICIFMH